MTIFYVIFVYNIIHLYAIIGTMPLRHNIIIIYQYTYILVSMWLSNNVSTKWFSTGSQFITYYSWTIVDLLSWDIMAKENKEKNLLWVMTVSK